MNLRKRFLALLAASGSPAGFIPCAIAGKLFKPGSKAYSIYTSHTERLCLVDPVWLT
jgi:hypothetical protein